MKGSFTGKEKNLQFTFLVIEGSSKVFWFFENYILPFVIMQRKRYMCQELDIIMEPDFWLHV